MEPLRMRTRSQVPESEKNLEAKQREKERQKRIKLETAPFITYKGKIVYHTTFVDCAEIGESLLKEAENSQDVFVIGFDIEWPFSWTSGPGKASVLQFSPNLDVCYVLQVSQIKSLPKSITEFVSHPKVRLTGINIKNDVRKLARDFKGIDVEKAIENCIDLGPLANNALNTKQRWSMEKLVEKFFEMRINKDKAVRMSKWHIVPLSKAQQVYAAIDAYASLKLYLLLKKMEKEMEMVENISPIENIF